MSNSVRTPRQGKSATSREIARAVDDEDWQKFRLTMKGKPTSEKLSMLREYYNAHVDDDTDIDTISTINTRVDNYIKALCRGGQLHPGESLVTALNHNWDLIIRK